MHFRLRQRTSPLQASYVFLLSVKIAIAHTVLEAFLHARLPALPALSS